MKVDNLQLVLICREVDLNYFGQEKVLKPLMIDLKSLLEENGLDVGGRIFKTRLICMLDDNLGSHWIGGFSTNFSANKFVCRYCLIERKRDNLSSLATTGEMRTPVNYNADVACAAVEGCSRGIARNSVLQGLSSFACQV
jgi:hypothetical protein